MRLTLSIFLVTLILTSCETLIDGNSPANGTPVPSPKNEVITSQKAVDAMYASLITQCDSIRMPEHPPLVKESFTTSPACEFNTAPWRVWSRLLRMKMIRPAFQEYQTKPYLLLRSEIKPVSTKANATEQRFTWSMYLEDGIGGDILWRQSLIIENGLQRKN